eukprot:gene12516-biopygen9460
MSRNDDNNSAQPCLDRFRTTTHDHLPAERVCVQPTGKMNHGGNKSRANKISDGNLPGQPAARYRGNDAKCTEMSYTCSFQRKNSVPFGPQKLEMNHGEISNGREQVTGKQNKSRGLGLGTSATWEDDPRSPGAAPMDRPAPLDPIDLVAERVCPQQSSSDSDNVSPPPPPPPPPPPTEYRQSWTKYSKEYGEGYGEAVRRPQRGEEGCVMHCRLRRRGSLLVTGAGGDDGKARLHRGDVSKGKVALSDTLARMDPRVRSAFGANSTLLAVVGAPLVGRRRSARCDHHDKVSPVRFLCSMSYMVIVYDCI